MEGILHAFDDSKSYYYWGKRGRVIKGKSWCHEIVRTRDDVNLEDVVRLGVIKYVNSIIVRSLESKVMLSLHVRVYILML